MVTQGGLHPRSTLFVGSFILAVASMAFRTREQKGVRDIETGDSATRHFDKHTQKFRLTTLRQAQFSRKTWSWGKFPCRHIAFKFAFPKETTRNTREWEEI